MAFEQEYLFEYFDDINEKQYSGALHLRFYNQHLFLQILRGSAA